MGRRGARTALVAPERERALQRRAARGQSGGAGRGRVRRGEREEEHGSRTSGGVPSAPSGAECRAGGGGGGQIGSGQWHGRDGGRGNRSKGEDKGRSEDARVAHNC